MKNLTLEEKIVKIIEEVKHAQIFLEKMRPISKRQLKSFVFLENRLSAVESMLFTIIDESTERENIDRDYQKPK